jgi:hypothetical protein
VVVVAPPPPPAPPPAAPPAALIDFAAALSALKASRPAKTSVAPAPAPEAFEPAEPVTFWSIAGQTALEVVEPVVPEDVVEVVDEVLPEDPEAVEAESLLDVQTGLGAGDEEIEVEAEPEPEPEALVEPEPEPVVEPEPEEPEPVAESEPIPELLAELESEPEPEWEEIAAPLPPVRPHGYELAADSITASRTPCPTSQAVSSFNSLAVVPNLRRSNGNSPSRAISLTTTASMLLCMSMPAMGCPFSM